MSDDLLSRARADRESRKDTVVEYDRSWNSREAGNVSERAESFLGVPVDIRSMEKVSDGRERTCWSFTADGREFLGGVYWERVPGPAGNAFFIALKIWKIPGKIDWPPSDEHGRDWCPRGYHRLHTLGDLADAVEKRKGIDEWIENEKTEQMTVPGWTNREAVLAVLLVAAVLLAGAAAVVFGAR